MSRLLLFAGYFIFFAFLFQRLARKSLVGLNPWQRMAIFGFRVMLGCLYGWIYLHYYRGDDTWMFFHDSVMEHKKLMEHPLLFFKDLSPEASFAQSNNFCQGLSFYIRDLEYFTMVKLLAVLNIFSGNHYYIDVLLFNFLSIWGSVFLFKLLNNIFPWHKKLLIITLFFIPTIGFWLSGIRSEGLLLLFIAIILYFTNQWFEHKKFFQMCWILAGFAGFLIYRNQYLWVFLPAYIAWTLGKARPQKAVSYFVSVYALCLMVFIAGIWISPQKNLATSMVSRQHEFAQLHGNTRFRLDSLEPSVSGVVRLLPQAFSNTFIRPLIIEAKGPLQIIAALEIMAVWILVILLLFFPATDWKLKMTHPLLLLMLFYGITQVLMIGYIVPFPGAIVRYKAIPELFLVITMGLSIDWKRIYSKIR